MLGRCADVLPLVGIAARSLVSLRRAGIESEGPVERRGRSRRIFQSRLDRPQRELEVRIVHARVQRPLEELQGGARLLLLQLQPGVGDDRLRIARIQRQRFVELLLRLRGEFTGGRIFPRALQGGRLRRQRRGEIGVDEVEPRVRFRRLSVNRDRLLQLARLQKTGAEGAHRRQVLRIGLQHLLEQGDPVCRRPELEVPAGFFDLRDEPDRILRIESDLAGRLPPASGAGKVSERGETLALLVRLLVRLVGPRQGP